MSRLPIEEIFDLQHPESVPLTDAQRAELERRWLAFQSDPDEGEPWEDVKKTLLEE